MSGLPARFRQLVSLSSEKICVCLYSSFVGIPISTSLLFYHMVCFAMNPIKKIPRDTFPYSQLLLSRWKLNPTRNPLKCIEMTITCMFKAHHSCALGRVFEKTSETKCLDKSSFLLWDSHVFDDFNGNLHYFPVSR